MDYVHRIMLCHEQAVISVAIHNLESTEKYLRINHIQWPKKSRMLWKTRGPFWWTLSAMCTRGVVPPFCGHAQKAMGFPCWTRSTRHLPTTQWISQPLDEDSSHLSHEPAGLFSLSSFHTIGRFSEPSQGACRPWSKPTGRKYWRRGSGLWWSWYLEGALPRQEDHRRWQAGRMEWRVERLSWQARL